MCVGRVRRDACNTVYFTVNFHKYYLFYLIILVVIIFTVPSSASFMHIDFVCCLRVVPRFPLNGWLTGRHTPSY